MQIIRKIKTIIIWGKRVESMCCAFRNGQMQKKMRGCVTLSANVPLLEQFIAASTGLKAHIKPDKISEKVTYNF